MRMILRLGRRKRRMRSVTTCLPASGGRREVRPKRALFYCFLAEAVVVVVPLWFVHVTVHVVAWFCASCWWECRGVACGFAGTETGRLRECRRAFAAEGRNLFGLVGVLFGAGCETGQDCLAAQVSGGPRISLAMGAACSGFGRKLPGRGACPFGNSRLATCFLTLSSVGHRR